MVQKNRSGYSYNREERLKWREHRAGDHSDGKATCNESIDVYFAAPLLLVVQRSLGAPAGWTLSNRWYSLSRSLIVLPGTSDGSFAGKQYVQENTSILDTLEGVYFLFFGTAIDVS